MLVFGVFFVHVLVVSGNFNISYYGNLDCDETSCWCISNLNGSVVEGTNRLKDHGYPNCHSCLAAASAESAFPSCTADGFYQRLQCQSEVSSLKQKKRCWCAHQISGYLFESVRYGPDLLPYCEQLAGELTAPLGARSEGRLRLSWNVRVSARRPDAPIILYWSLDASLPLERWSSAIVPAPVAESPWVSTAELGDFLPDAAVVWLHVRSLSVGGRLGPLSAVGRAVSLGSTHTIKDTKGRIPYSSSPRPSAAHPHRGAGEERSLAPPSPLGRALLPRRRPPQLDGRHEGWFGDLATPPATAEVWVGSAEAGALTIPVGREDRDLTVWLQPRGPAGPGPFSPPKVAPGSSSVQCSATECFCVDKATRQPLPVSQRPRGSGLPDCRGCENEMSHLATDHPIASGNVPNCSADGYFAQVQCAAFASYCICVSQLTGRHHPASFKGPHVQPDCQPETEPVDILAADFSPSEGFLAVRQATAARYTQFQVYHSFSPSGNAAFVSSVFVDGEYLEEGENTTSYRLSQVVSPDAEAFWIRVRGVTSKGYFGPTSEPFSATRIANSDFVIPLH